MNPGAIKTEARLGIVQRVGENRGGDEDEHEGSSRVMESFEVEEKEPEF